MPAFIDLSNRRFGKLVALYVLPKIKGKPRKWFCQCDCGNTSTPTTTNLNEGNSAACGQCRAPTASAFKKKHGEGRTPTYSTWKSMWQRVRHAEDRDYAHVYRNVEVDPRWADYRAFKADMGERPSGMTLDRKNNDIGYNKDNCRWATPLEQTRNRRITKRYTVDGVTKTVMEWAREAGISFGAAQQRLKRHGSLEISRRPPSI